MTNESILAERLLHAYASTCDWKRCREIVLADRDLSHAIGVERAFSHMAGIRDASPAKFGAMLPGLVHQQPAVLAPFFTTWFLYFNTSQLSVSEIQTVQRSIDSILSGESWVHGMLRVHLAGAYLRENDVREATAIADREVELLGSQENSFCHRYLCTYARLILGRCIRYCGDYQKAHAILNRARRDATELGILVEWTILQEIATLHWAAGQYSDALRLHGDPARRADAHRAGKFDFLATSLLSSAKCAIDLKATATAETELQKVVPLLDAYPQIRPALRGQALLFSGELEVQKENYDRGMDLLMAAQKHFESMDPPHHSGALQAKTALGHFALYLKEYRTAGLIMRRLSDEAEESRCLDARSRLLALETLLFVSERPPGRAAYNDIVGRLHLINSPTLMMRALGNLYSYALEFLDQREQAFLLMRIHNLRNVLEEGWFDDLYRSCVTERYAGAIENRLARLVDKDWEGWEECDEPGRHHGVDEGAEEPPP